MRVHVLLKFIKRVVKEKENARLTEHFITLLQVKKYNTTEGGITRFFSLHHN